MFPPPPARSQYSVLIRVRVSVNPTPNPNLQRLGREGCHVCKGGCLPSMLQRLGREGCHVGKGNEKKNVQAPLAPPYEWPVAINPWQLSGLGQGGWGGSRASELRRSPPPRVDFNGGRGGGGSKGGSQPKNPWAILVLHARGGTNHSTPWGRVRKCAQKGGIFGNSPYMQAYMALIYNNLCKVIRVF